MPSRTQARRGMLILGLLLTLSGGCQFVQPDDEVLYACAPEGRCPSVDQLCSTQNLCLPRNQALRILQPENNARVPGTARVEVSMDVAGLDPDSLVLTITRGGQAPATLVLRRVQVGRYVVQWTPSRGPGTYELRASAPNEGLESAQVTVVVDSDPPELGGGALPPEGPTSPDCGQDAVDLK
jgi:hypothetical protein